MQPTPEVTVDVCIVRLTAVVYCWTAELCIERSPTSARKLDAVRLGVLAPYVTRCCT
jgi:hypothetical protein